MNMILFDYYRKSVNNRYQVKAIPFILYFFKGRWYLIAEDLSTDNNEIKKYIIEKISNISQIEDYPIKSVDRKKLFEKRKDLIINLESKGHTIFWTNEIPTEESILRFDEDVAYIFEINDYGYYQKTSEKKNNDGSIDVSFKFASFYEMWFFISEWLGKFEIIKMPTELKNQLLNKIQEINKKIV